MPRKKLKKSVRKSTVVKSQRQKIKKRFDLSKWTESYSSFLLGIVAVIVGVLFVVSIIRGQHVTQDTSSLSLEPSPTTAATQEPGQTFVEDEKTYYLVKQNDSLWEIAVTLYNDGYQWTKIAKANNLNNPSVINEGNKLLLPDTPNPSSFGEIEKDHQMTQETNSITGNTYTVQKGDSLWDIAVRAYGDGYKWTEVAKANNLSNPDLIFSGNILTIPR